MAERSVVVVESPAKAKTINKYLGGDFEVLASFGHVRDLPPKDGSVLPDDDFAMRWQVDDRGKKQIDAIAKAIKGADRLYLATDPDREGEAISWHVQEELASRNVLGGKDVTRVVFNEITKGAVLDAIANPRDLNQELIEAYLARRALDYLVGFTLSPVLWRKLPGAKSAGRVQSVALRLICEREAEIEAFKPVEYWSLHADMTTKSGDGFTARLTHLDGEKLDKHGLKSKTDADRAVNLAENRSYTVRKIERKTQNRNPAPPFTTSTLQQEASRKLGFGATNTMRVAQRLYEGVDLGGETVGLITYMRTDSTILSGEAISGTRSTIQKLFGDAYLPNEPRVYKTKAKNAQEAHEAIRPTDLSRTPDAMRSYLEPEQHKLYELIWKRTMASQMSSAVIDRVSADIEATGATALFRATGSVVKFDGFLKLYFEDIDDKPADDEDDAGRLPNMEEGEPSHLKSLKPEQHFTQPPPRYSEASLVKKMEELGIGRPSTYASILKVLQDRDYVRLDKRRFTPEDRGRLVTAFLSSFFDRYFEYGFTADLEEQLDDISGGRLAYKKVLRDFWLNFHQIIERTMELSPIDVRDTVDRELGPHFFPADENGDTEKARICPRCDDGRLGLNFGRYGAYIACANYPDCRYTRQLDESPEDAIIEFPKNLGVDPDSSEMISLRKGPYGIYVQVGEQLPKEKGKKAPPKPKRVSLLKKMSAADIDFDTALRLLALPREIGEHPESKQMIAAGIGRYGPYLKHGNAYVTIPPDDDVLTIGMNRAVEVIAQAGEKGKASATRELGFHPNDNKKVVQGKGRFGPYVKHGSLYASIPRDLDPDTVSFEEALRLLEEKAAKKAAGKKAPSKKAAAKKAKASKAKKAKAKTAKAKKASAKKSGAKKAAASKTEQADG